jgi:tetratricopeptide (TPR) repeat protein
MVGLISVFSSVIAVVLFYFFSLELTKNKLISLISALVLAFNYLFWFYAEIAEVFALNSLFVVLLAFLGVLYYKYKKIKYLYLLSFFAGLSMTNNYIISFLFPSLLILVLTNYKELLSKPKALIKCILLGLLGLLVYIYIPIAASHNPPVNWDNAKDLNSFLQLVLRRDYGLFGVGPAQELSLVQRLFIEKDFFLSVIVQLTPPVIFFIILGAIYLIKKTKILFLVFILAFFLSGPVFMSIVGLPLASSFLIGIYERFFTMASVILLFFFPFGIKAFIEIINYVFKKNTYEKLFLLVFLIIPIFLFKYNFNKTDLSNVWTGDNLAYDMLSSIPQNSYLFVSGDTPQFNLWYMHFGLKFRPDVKLLSFAGNKSITIEQNKYLKKYPKDKDNPNLLPKMMLELLKTNKVFSISPIQPDKGQKLTWIPYGITYDLVKDKTGIPTKEQFLNIQQNITNGFKNINFDNQGLGAYSITISDISLIYSNALIAQGTFINDHYKDSKLTLSFFERARDLDTSNRRAYLALGYYYTDKKNCAKAIENVKTAMDIYPFDIVNYYLLYYNYKFCALDNSRANNVIKLYNQTFKSDFFKDIKKEIISPS